jgi:hypothetical protein
MDGFDLIGDIHGHAEPLRALLEKLGYRSHGGRFGYRHPSRKAIFVGDFIDRGPGQREVIDIVRSMIENDAALAVMGNHELNALAYHTLDPEHGGYLRKRIEKNTHQHQAFLDEHAFGSRELSDALAWFYTLPLWLDLGELRVVHASWLPQAMIQLQAQLSPDHTLTEPVLLSASREDSQEFAAVEGLLKGLEAELPAGLSYLDKGGHERRRARLRWWQSAEGQSWRTMALIPDKAVIAQLPDAPLPCTLSVGYAPDQPPVFFGHYRLEGDPAPLADNVACLDYNVAKPGGKLVAYRWDGEFKLRQASYEWVAR